MVIPFSKYLLIKDQLVDNIELRIAAVIELGEGLAKMR